MRATEFLTEYAGMDEPYPDLHQDPASVQDYVTYYATIPDTDKKLFINFYNLLSDKSDDFKVVDISFGIRQPDRFSTNYDPPTGLS